MTQRYVIKGGQLIRTSDNAVIPQDVSNADYQQYLSWMGEGHQPVQMDLKRTYRANRRREYPSIERQLEALYDARNGDDTKLKAIDQQIADVKLKYPKA